MPHARVALVAAIIFMAGCGGGSPDVDVPVQVHYDEAPLHHFVFEDSLGGDGCTGLTLTPFPEDLVAIRVQDAGGVFRSSPVSFRRDRGDHVLLCLPWEPALAVGSHAGTVRLTLCTDAACTSIRALSEPTLDYQVDVLQVVSGLPPLAPTFLVDVQPVSPLGVVQGNTVNFTLALFVGQRVEVNVGVPIVLWSPGLIVPGDVVPSFSLEFPAESPGAFALTFLLPEGAEGASMSFWARVADGRSLQLEFLVFP